MGRELTVPKSVIDEQNFKSSGEPKIWCAVLSTWLRTSSVECSCGRVTILNQLALLELADCDGRNLHQSPAL